MSAAQVDILCITAHPDDVEISMAGTVLHHMALGHSVGLVELTAGELGTRGSAEIRKREAAAAADVLGVAFRYQLGLPDGFFRADPESLKAVVTVLRCHRPRLVLTNAVSDRHPDHGRGAALVAEACFLSGLRRIGTSYEGAAQDPWRPAQVLHGVQDRAITPHVIVDITSHWSKKMEALLCFRSQFFDPHSKEPSSPISDPDFLPFLEARARDLGRTIGVTFAEGFTAARPVGVKDLTELR
ncbi:MAG: bacillithiol biosynthesis deacetylase BshB1 [Flavobacteriales bacterium]|nr:bacillithiol biosynthesis deacetylase BshB1 [Flavobacteriales bacterium]